MPSPAGLAPAAGTDTAPTAIPAPAPFFTRRTPGGPPGLALFLNAGDPPLPVLRDLVLMLDEEGVDCLELAVPFPDSVTDGPVIRRSARRALDRGAADLDDVLAFIADVRPHLTHLRIALLADWSHSLKHRDLATTTREIAAAGADGLLVHALPPRLRATHLESAAAAGLPVVTTCYTQSPPTTQAQAAAQACAYLYLVAHYGRSGTAPAAGHAALAQTVTALRAHTTSPIAVGFGVSTRADVQAVGAAGADAAIIGSAAVAAVERAQEAGTDVTEAFRTFVRSVLPATPHRTA
ncbi:tryptophan synthase subunit alpha [Streptomyces avidinii]|uniref:tryptophan synthase subunit alpha n=1 Tax=Streptomyces avidinii TaxID=1895 RepID=UPI0038689AA9|nr:tryptophan synthase subunit alpha [Streptomyces avidinii]WTB02129.1 tryptophan synthase subunit alpha [Streptomyces avidinii]